MRPRPATWGVLAGATLLFGAPVLVARALPNGEDVLFAAQMTQGMVEGWLDGRLYPSWVDFMNLGYGAPAFCFYPPLAFVPAGALAWLFDNVTLGLAVTVLAGVFLSGLGAYVAARPFGTEVGAAAAAVTYMLAPYHVLDFYERGAVAELTAFAWLPFVFHFTRQLTQRPRWACGAGLAATYAGLVMTHLITAYLALLVIVPYAVARVARHKAWNRLLPLAAAGTVAVSACGAYLVPVLLERDDVNFRHFAASGYGDWRSNFAFQGGEGDSIGRAIDAGVGATVLLALAAAIVLVVRARRGAAFGEGLTLAGLSLWVVFLQSPLSAFVWSAVPLLGTAQFPWRFGSLQALLAALLVATALATESPRESRGRGVVLLLAALPALFVAATFAGRRPCTFDDATARHPTARAFAKEEYFPAGADADKVFDPAHDPGSPARLLAPRGRVEVLEWTSHGRRIRVETPVSGRLVVRTFAHPGWEVRLDGGAVPLRSFPPLELIAVDVAAGEHEVEVRFTGTAGRHLGTALSGLTVAGMLVLLILRRRRGQPGRARSGTSGG